MFFPFSHLTFHHLPQILLLNLDSDVVSDVAANEFLKCILVWEIMAGGDHHSVINFSPGQNLVRPSMGGTQHTSEVVEVKVPVDIDTSMSQCSDSVLDARNGYIRNVVV